jgi:putative ABC transport system substrate-binding protein
VKRREFISLLSGAAAAWPLAAHAQQGERMRLIGVLIPALADDAVYQTGCARPLAGSHSEGGLHEHGFPS